MIYLSIAIAAFTMLLPLFLIALVSFLNQDGRFIGLENYTEIFFKSNMLRAFLNSVYVTLAATVIQLAVASTSAYAFSRMNFPAKNKLFLAAVATLMLPSTVTMIPLFVILKYLKLLNSYEALILPVAFSAYGTFMLRQFFILIPRDLEDAAKIDGCNSFEIFWHVILPCSKEALMTLAAFTFITSWRSFMWPLIVIQSEELFTIPIALSRFRDINVENWPLILAGVMIMIVPMALVFFASLKFKKSFIF
jgi:multiple sugar transport system permease protein